MKKIISGLLVLGVILPGIVSASTINDLQDQVTSLREVLVSLGDIFRINYPESALGLITPLNIDVVSSTATSTAQPLKLDNIVLTTTTLLIGGPKVSYRATIVNPNDSRSRPFVGVTIQGWIEQSNSSSGLIRVPAGGALVACSGSVSVGSVYPGTCLAPLSFGTLSSSSAMGLVPGPAQAVFELKQGTVVLTTQSVPIQLFKQALSTLTPLAVGTSIYSGTTRVIVGQWSVKVSDLTDLQAITFQVSGTGKVTDLKNVSFYANGAQVGATLNSVSMGGVAKFSLGNQTYLTRFNPGVSSTLQIYADVFVAPGKNFQFNISKPSDVSMLDSGGRAVTVSVQKGGTLISVVPGTMTLSLASDSPNGSLSRSSGTALLKIVAYAAGEPVRVRRINFGLDFGSAGGTLNDSLRNIRLIDDQGIPVGPAIASLVTAKSCTGATFSKAVTAAVNCFGSATAPLTYTIPSNTTRVWTLRADILPGANFSDIRAKILAGSQNIQGVTSKILSSTGGVSGNKLVLNSGHLITAIVNPAVSTQTVAASQTGAKIGSYVLTASSDEGVNLTSIQIKMSSSAVLFSNVRLMVGSMQFGVTQPILSANGSYNFAGALSLPAGGIKVIDVYADVLSSITSIVYPAVTSITSCAGSGAVTLTPIGGCSATGQSVQGAGQARVQVSLDSASPGASHLVMGSAGNTLGIFRFTEVSNAEDVKVTQLNVFDSVASTASVKPAFSNLGLYQGATLLGTAGLGISSQNGKGYIYTFNLSTPIFVPKSGSVAVILKGDVASYSSSGATDNTTHVFKIATSTDSINSSTNFMIALGKTSNATSSVVLSLPVGNTQTVLRTRLHVSGATLGVTSGRSKMAIDDIGSISFTADTAGSLLLNGVTITFAGSAPSGTAFFGGSGVVLFDPETATVYQKVGFSPTGILYNFNSYPILAGTTKTFRIRINSNLASGGGTTANAVAGVSQSLSALINSSVDVTYTTAIAGGTPGVHLPSASFGAPPIVISNVSYAQGT